MNPGNGIETNAWTVDTIHRLHFHINESRQRDWNTARAFLRVFHPPFTLMNPGNGIETTSAIALPPFLFDFHINESRQRDWNK